MFESATVMIPEPMPLFATARASTPDEAALITMLALLGLRIGEACSADVQDMGTQRGHRTLHIIGKWRAVLPAPCREWLERGLLRS